jgi:hypothetical protein
MKTIREARDADVETIRNLFVGGYGPNYPFKGFYDTEWLKKAVYDDGTMMLVMEMDERIVATASMVFTSGGMDDMIGEVGRLVATTDPQYRGKGLYVELVQELVDCTGDRILFLMAEGRTPHRGSQRILETLHWIPIGFEPMKYLLDHRESVVVYAKTQGMAKALRKNNPHVIAEVSVLAQTVLHNMGYLADVIVEDEVDGYPTGQTFSVEHLREQQGVTSLLRIERGRVSQKEIFGNFSLSHGFFRISEPNSNYLVAREGEAVLGAVGFSHDIIDKKVRIFELIEFDDAVKGALLAALDRIAREELQVEYMEVDVSAYSPKIQRTFERLGFVPVAYCPSMVFEQVERLDVVRMAKLCCPYDLGPMRLLESAAQMQQIVEKGFEDRFIGMEITAGTRRTDLFRHIPDGEMYHLARIAKLREYKAGTTLVREGEQADYLYILVSGEAQVLKNGKRITALQAGNLIGDMALVDKYPRSADVVLTQPSTVITIEIQRLERLLDAYPRLGYIVAMNLARGLSEKLRHDLDTVMSS